MSSNDILVKCLSKSIKTEIKSISVCKVKFIDSSGKELSKKNTIKGMKQVLCLGVEKFYVLQGDLQELIEYLSYQEIEGIELDIKNNDCFIIWLKGPLPFSRHKIKRVLIYHKYRGQLIRDFMCYFSIYFMQKHSEIKELKLALSQLNEVKPVKSGFKGLSKIYKQFTYKNYE